MLEDCKEEGEGRRVWRRWVQLAGQGVERCGLGVDNPVNSEEGRRSREENQGREGARKRAWLSLRLDSTRQPSKVIWGRYDTA